MGSKINMLKMILSEVLNGLYPPKCLACNDSCVQEVALICHACWASLEFVHKPLCNKCGVAMPASYLGDICMRCVNSFYYFDAARSVFRYNNASKKMLHRFKFEDKTMYAKPFANMLFKLLYKDLLDGVDVIAAVPLHNKRLGERKYNCASLMAFELAKRAKKPFLPTAIVKIKETKLQTNLNYNDRKHNLDGAFLSDAQSVSGASVLLVDDVMTTGATVNQCALSLKAAGASRVVVTTLARTY